MFVETLMIGLPVKEVESKDLHLKIYTRKCLETETKMENPVVEKRGHGGWV